MTTESTPRFTHQTHHRALFALSFLLMLALSACGGSGGDPTSVWTDDGLKTQGSLAIVPNTFRVREGESEAIEARFTGSAAFDGTRVQWSVIPASAGVVRNGRFEALEAGTAEVTARFSSVSAQAVATVIPEPVDIEPLMPNDMIGWAGLELADSVAVRLVGRRGNPAPEVPVHFDIVEGNGDVSHVLRETGNDGVARVQWRLGEESGQNRLRIWADDLAPVELTAEGLPDRETAELRPISGGGQEGTVGELLPDPFMIEVTDVNGNPLAGVPVEWNLIDGVAIASDGFTELGSGAVRGLTDGQGRSAIYWRLGTRAGDQVMQAYIGGSASALEAASNGKGNGRDKTDFGAKAKPGEVESVEVDPDSVLLPPQASAQLKATVKDKFGNEVKTDKINWSVANDTIAEVDKSGVVTSLSYGSTFVTAKVGPAKDSAGLTVPAPIASVAIQPSGPLALEVGDQMTLSASVYDALGASVDTASITWTSLDPTVVSIDAAGFLSAQSVGASSVVATTTCCEAADTIDVEISESTGPSVASVTASVESLRLEVSGTAALEAVAYDELGEVVSTELTWSSTDPAVVAVDPSGEALGVAVGLANLIVSAACCTPADTVAVEVEPSGSGGLNIRATPDSITFGGPGETAQIDVVVSDSVGDAVEGVSLSWESSDPLVATVDQMGNVIAQATGTALVVVSVTCCGGGSDTVGVRVGPNEDPPPSVTAVIASVNELSLTALEQTADISVSVFDAEGLLVSDPELTWTSSDPSVASVDGSGVVTAHRNGGASVVVRSVCCGVADTVAILVEQQAAAVSITPRVVLLGLDDSIQLTASAVDANGFALAAATQATWESSNAVIAEVDDLGLVSALGRRGIVEITARMDGVEGSVQAAIQPPPELDPIFTDGFESGDKSLSSNGVSWGSAAGNPTPVTADSYTGDYSLQFDYQADPPGEDGWVEQRFRVAEGASEIYFEYYWFVPKNFRMRDGVGAENNKLFRVHQGSDDGTFSVTTEFHRTSSDFTAGHRMIAQQTGGATRESNPNPLIGPDGPIFTGEWNQIRFGFKAASGLGAADGFYKMWVNGVLVSQLVDFEFWNQKGKPATLIEHGYLMGWANTGYDERTVFYIDDFSVFTGNPGW